MKILIDPYHVIGIVGLAKNTGKTTTLNHLIKLYAHEPIALTSIGLDGEAIDQITHLPKPRIHVKKGTLIATAEQCLRQGTITYKIIEKTPYPSALGPIVIIETLTAGDVLIAGPVLNEEMAAILNTLKKKVSKVFVDGALNRKTFANIQAIDAIVLSTGASVADDIEKTIDKTIYTYKLFSLPIAKKIVFDPDIKMIAITSKRIVHFTSKQLIEFEDHKTLFKKYLKMLYIKGAVTPSIAAFIVHHKIGRFTLVAEDPTKFLFSEKTAQYLKTLRIRLKVLKPCPILFITINPTSPKGTIYNEHIFVTRLARNIPLPILNVMKRSDDDAEIE